MLSIAVLKSQRHTSEACLDVIKLDVNIYLLLSRITTRERVRENRLLTHIPVYGINAHV